MIQKTRLLDLINFGNTEIVRFADRLSEDERKTLGVGDQWSARDLLAHITEWKRHDAANLSTNSWEDESSEVDNEDQLNAEITERYRRITWTELRHLVDQAHEDTLTVVDSLTEEQLNDPERYKPLNGRPAWRYVVSSAIMHPLASHLRPWYIQHGQADYATRLAEQEARMLLELHDAPDWRGVVRYNLGCHYALLGNKEAALEELAEALKLNPGLAPFSHQDPDLASLHGSPELAAIAPLPSET